MSKKPDAGNSGEPNMRDDRMVSTLVDQIIAVTEALLPVDDEHHDLFDALVDVFTFYMSLHDPLERQEIANELKRRIPKMLEQAAPKPASALH
jgi:hypothetical protein